MEEKNKCADLLTDILIDLASENEEHCSAEVKTFVAIKLLQNHAGSFDPKFTTKISGDPEIRQYDLSMKDDKGEIKGRTSYIELYCLGYGFDGKQKQLLDRAINASIKGKPELFEQIFADFNERHQNLVNNASIGDRLQDALLPISTETTPAGNLRTQ